MAESAKMLTFRISSGRPLLLSVRPPFLPPFLEISKLFRKVSEPPRLAIGKCAQSSASATENEGRMRLQNSYSK